MLSYVTVDIYFYMNQLLFNVRRVSLLFELSGSYFLRQLGEFF